MKILGIDVGGSGLKGGVVDIATGQLENDRVKIETPEAANVEAMAKIFKELVDMHNWTGPVGCGFPSIVRKGVAHTAANIHNSWIGTNIEQVFGEISGCPVFALNDADAAGVAEMQFGKGKGKMGVVLLITIGSGLGSALFNDGVLVPNTEFGHLHYKDMVSEHYASNTARKRDELGWEEWGKRFNEYLVYIERVLCPDHIFLGGGISKKFDKYKDVFTASVPVEPATLLNDAGTIGAAVYAYQKTNKNT